MSSADLEGTPTPAASAQVAPAGPGFVARLDAWLAGRLWWVLGALALAAAAMQALVLAEQWRANPFATTLEGDAKYYWDWAADVAAGTLARPEPFHAAPLYPYLLGVLRFFGVGLLGVYALQAALHVAAGVYLGWIGARRLSPATGVLAAGWFLFARDAVYFDARALGTTLQVALAALLIGVLWSQRASSSLPRALLAGLVVGLNALANPALMLAVPLVPLGLYFHAGRGAGGVRAAGATLAAAVLAIAPATLHNLARGELIPISTHGGLTFAQGNGPGAEGVYVQVEGISTVADFHDRDSRRVAEEARGRALTWSEIDRHYYDVGLAWWKSDPLHALGVLVKKLFWFAAGRHYSESYLPTLEMEEGISGRLALAPVEVAWLVLPALAGAWLLRRDRRTLFPLLLVLGIALFTVAVFFYSSRYRLPALPALALLASHALVTACDGRSARGARGLAAGAWLVGLALGPLGRAVGFDRPESYRAGYDLWRGTTHLSRGELGLALPALSRAADASGGRARALYAEALRLAGRRDEAAVAATQAMFEDADEPLAPRVLAILAAEAGVFERASQLFARALGLDPADWTAEMGLASSLLSMGRAAEALPHYEMARAAAPGSLELSFNYAACLAALGRRAEAEALWREQLAAQPGFSGARLRLVEAALRGARYAEALELLHIGLTVDPQNGELAKYLAWLLATAPQSELRSGEQALAIAAALTQGPGAERADLLGVLAAAQAEVGRFEDAERTALRAAELARAAGVAEQAAENEKRAGLFRDKTPYRLPAP